MSLLEVENLCTHFQTPSGVVKAVDGVSFQVQPGETFGIVGESGSGKSALSLSIMGLLPTGLRGRILFAGQDLLQMAPKALQKLRGDRIAMIFQDPMTGLNPTLRIARQLTEVLEVHKGFTPKAAHQAVIQMLGRVGIADAERRARQYPQQFSGGMRQRVMIAMALLCEPALLIADEPTTSLDVTIAAQILHLMQTLQRQSKTAIILITHDLAVVAGMAHQVAVMYAGRLVEQAPPQALYDAPAHPYTRGLLACAPRLETPHGQALVPIAGAPPSLSNLPAGCHFAPRCPRVASICHEQYPALVQNRERMVACWHPLQGSS